MRFHKFLLLFLLFGKPVAGQTLTPFVAEARGGDTVTLGIEISEPADFINVYRKTGVTSTPSLVGQIAVQPGVWSYSWTYTMPGGSVSQYRFFAVPKRGSELLDESNGVRITRKK